jgi:hypothetical protein
MEAGFDFGNRTFTSAPTDAAEMFVRWNHSPQWSPDPRRNTSSPRARCARGSNARGLPRRSHHPRKTARRDVGRKGRDG